MFASDRRRHALPFPAHGSRSPPIRFRRETPSGSIPIIFRGGHAAAFHSSTTSQQSGWRQGYGRGRCEDFRSGQWAPPRSWRLTLVSIPSSWGQHSWGPLREACGHVGFASLMTPARTETRRAPVERGWSPPPDRSRKMSLADAHAFAFSLAATLIDRKSVV